MLGEEHTEMVPFVNYIGLICDDMEIDKALENKELSLKIKNDKLGDVHADYSNII